jgi:glycine C-acetyltransferase/8-amino-7-oxononanoate synthase
MADPGREADPSSVAERLEELRRSGLYRRMRTVQGAQGPRVRIEGREVLLLCSNNYLDLTSHPAVRTAAAEACQELGTGAGASRLVSGNMDPHLRLERRLAAFHEQSEALLFGSGYLANTGVIAALARPGGVVYSDQLNHASIVDGCRLAGAAKFIYRHRDTEHLAWAMARSAGPAALIVTDGIFSMDGDLAALDGLLKLARRHGARLMVDEAHAVGTYGPGGRGVAAASGLAGEVDVITGTLGKALGSYGAYAASGAELRELLVNTARPLIFSTGLPPAVIAAAAAALELIEQEPERIERLGDNAEVLREALAEEDLQTGASSTQIIPVMVGEPRLAVAACASALQQGVYAQAIRPPTVPDGSSRLRLTVMASHRPEELRDAARAIARALREVGAGADARPLRVPEPKGEPTVRRVEAGPWERSSRAVADEGVRA